MRSAMVRLRRRALIVSALCAAILGGGGAAIALSASGSADPGQQTAPTASGASPGVSAAFAVFNRPRSSSDDVPQGLAGVLRRGYGYAGPDLADSRRVQASNGETAYLVPSADGICVVNVNEAFCAPGSALGGADAVDLCSPSLPQGKIELEWLLPDGATDVRLRLVNGDLLSFPAGYNVYITDLPISQTRVDRIDWSAQGNDHSVDAGIPADGSATSCVHPGQLPPPSELPQLQGQ